MASSSYNEITVLMCQGSFLLPSVGNQDSDPHQIDKLDRGPDPHHFADDKPKYMDYEPI